MPGFKVRVVGLGSLGGVFETWVLLPCLKRS